MINNSGLPNEQKKELIKRFDDIVELSDMFSEIDNELMGSFDKVDAYIKKNPDNIKNNAARNAILRKYLDDRIKEYDGDPNASPKSIKLFVELIGKSSCTSIFIPLKVSFIDTNLFTQSMVFLRVYFSLISLEFICDVLYICSIINLSLDNQDNEHVRNYIDETLTSIQQDGFIKTGAVEDMNRIIDLAF
jgi:hypothetical protein